jgi:hypothetical protein
MAAVIGDRSITLGCKRNAMNSCRTEAELSCLGQVHRFPINRVPFRQSEIYSGPLAKKLHALLFDAEHGIGYLQTTNLGVRSSNLFGRAQLPRYPVRIARHSHGRNRMPHERDIKHRERFTEGDCEPSREAPTAIRARRMQKDQLPAAHTILPSHSGLQASSRRPCCHKESAVAYL